MGPIDIFFSKKTFFKFKGGVHRWGENPILKEKVQFFVFLTSWG